jgi:hypothetical protein
VKEQEQKLALFKDTMAENSRLKDTLAGIRKTHMGELLKYIIKLLNPVLVENY